MPVLIKPRSLFAYGLASGERGPILGAERITLGVAAPRHGRTYGSLPRAYTERSPEKATEKGQGHGEGPRSGRGAFEKGAQDLEKEDPLRQSPDKSPPEGASRRTLGLYHRGGYANLGGNPAARPHR